MQPGPKPITGGYRQAPTSLSSNLAWRGAPPEKMADIQRALQGALVEQLRAAADEPGWWRDVLADASLVVAARGSYLNVYWRGQSLFRAEAGASGLKATTHEKFLLDPGLDGQVRLLDSGDFDVAGTAARAFMRRYDASVLAKMKRAAAVYSGPEKTGCHDIATASTSVIDVEIAFPGTVEVGGRSKRSPRVDLAAVEPMDDDAVRLVFWEAKHFSNTELVAAGDDVPVLSQIAGYQAYASDHREAIESCYTGVAKDLLAIRRLGWARPLSPLIEDVAEGRRRLTLGDEPQVGLVIFGYDRAQWAAWAGHLAKLAKHVVVRRAGDAKNIRL